MDDGPRTGGLQALLLIIALTAGFVTFGAGAWGAAPFLVASLGAVIWLELYARRRAREEEAERQRRLREGAISHLDFDHDPFGPR
jgi:hypothetical protein